MAAVTAAVMAAGAGRGEARRGEEAEGGVVGSALCVAAAALLALLESTPSVSAANGLF